MIVDCFKRDLRKTKVPEEWRWNEEPVRCVGYLKGGDVVSCLRLFKRTIEISQKTKIDVFGIGGLWTVPEYRGQGLAKQCIRHVLMTTDVCSCAAIIAHGKRCEDSVFLHCGFDSLGPSPTKPGNQDIYIRYLTSMRIGEDANWKLIPDLHF